MSRAARSGVHAGIPERCWGPRPGGSRRPRRVPGPSTPVSRIEEVTARVGWGWGGGVEAGNRPSSSPSRTQSPAGSRGPGHLPSVAVRPRPGAQGPPGGLSSARAS